ncbi:MAG: hupE [Chlorobi bacterium]|nr:hupE [Chlorobiota bacterium]
MMNFSPRISRFALPLVAVLTAMVLPGSLHAHPLPGGHGGFLGGASHPLLGLDHILAMIAVGIWAGQAGGKARWYLPLSFVAVMLVGGLLGATGVTIPMVEPGIIGSVLVLGVLIAAAVRMPLPAAMAIVGLMALFHGHAHGAEMPAGTSGVLYGCGFLLSTALLHLAGIGMTAVMARVARPVAVRLAGVAVIAGAAVLIVW